MSDEPIRVSDELWHALHRPIQYVLDEHGEPQPCDNDTLRWSLWFESDERRFVRKQTFVLGDPELVSEPVQLTVSTVFLGTDHAFEGPPKLWETMLFAPDGNTVLARYTSRADAIAGHNQFVAELGGPVLEGTDDAKRLD